MTSSKDPIDCGEFEVKRATAAALLVIDADDCEHWIPTSQICGESEICDGSEPGDVGDLVLPEWLAAEKGLA